MTSSEVDGMPRRPRRTDSNAFVHISAGAQVEIFAVIDDKDVEGFGEFHGAAHDAGVHDGAAVVRDGNDARGAHGADSGQLFAEAALVMAPMGKTLTLATSRAFCTI